MAQHADPTAPQMVYYYMKFVYYFGCGQNMNYSRDIIISFPPCCLFSIPEAL